MATQTTELNLALSPGDLYRLRQAALFAQRAKIRAELAQQNLRELLLSLERRYKLLGQGAAIDINTGAIALDTNHSATQGNRGQVKSVIRGDAE